MSEVLLRRVILDELEYEPSVDATHIGVAVDKGKVSRHNKELADVSLGSFSDLDASKREVRFASVN